MLSVSRIFFTVAVKIFFEAVGKRQLSFINFSLDDRSDCTRIMQFAVEHITADACVNHVYVDFVHNFLGIS